MISRVKRHNRLPFGFETACFGLLVPRKMVLDSKTGEGDGQTTKCSNVRDRNGKQSREVSEFRDEFKMCWQGRRQQWQNLFLFLEDAKSQLASALRLEGYLSRHVELRCPVALSDTQGRSAFLC